MIVKPIIYYLGYCDNNPTTQGILKKESLKIHIHNINVKIHSPEIDEMGLEYNDEQGVYTYNVTQLLDRKSVV